MRATLEAFRARQKLATTPRSRKEVIQPQVPLRLPCYDFAPVTDLTLDGCPLAVGPPVSGPSGFHGVTGGVYKARERIHRGVADPRLLAIPTFLRLNAGSPPRVPGRTAGNWERELRSLRDLTQHLTTRADDSHAAPVLALRRGADVSTGLHQHVKPR